MSDEAPGETYPAGVDVPGTPAPFPFGLVSFAFAGATAMCTILWLYDYPLVPALAAASGWLVAGLMGLARGQWRGFAAGLPVILAPLAIAIMMIVALSPGV